MSHWKEIVLGLSIALWASTGNAEVTTSMEVMSWTYNHARSRTATLRITGRDAQGGTLVLSVSGLSTRNPEFPALIGASRVRGFPVTTSNGRITIDDAEFGCARSDLCAGLGIAGHASPLPVASAFPSGPITTPYVTPFTLRGAIPITRPTSPVVPIVGQLEIENLQGEASFRPDPIEGWSVSAQGTLGRIVIRTPSPLTLVNAASQTVAPAVFDSFHTVYSAAIVGDPVVAQGSDCTKELGGYRLLVSAFELDPDVNGCLTYVGNGQANFRLPANSTSVSKLRFDVVKVESPRTVRAVASASNIEAKRVAPGLFTQSGTGRGVPAGSVLRVRADGSSVYESVPATGGIEISSNDREIYLVLYGTGIRGRNQGTDVRASWNGIAFEVPYAGPQPTYPGVDQVNLLIPTAAILASAHRSGQLVLQIDTRTASGIIGANAVELSFR